MNTLHLMVDIETGARSNDAAILSIGACLFHPSFVTTEYIKKEWRISTDSNIDHNRAFSQDTLSWWEQQGAEARQIALSGVTSLTDALQELYLFSQPAKKIWANDPDFDVNILVDACEATKTPWNFPYWARLSVRTIKWLAYPDGGAPAIEGTAHSAIDDAVFQADLVSKCFLKIRNEAEHSRL